MTNNRKKYLRKQGYKFTKSGKLKKQSLAKLRRITLTKTRKKVASYKKLSNSRLSRLINTFKTFKAQKTAYKILTNRKIKATLNPSISSEYQSALQKFFIQKTTIKTSNYNADSTMTAQEYIDTYGVVSFEKLTPLAQGEQYGYYDEDTNTVVYPT